MRLGYSVRYYGTGSRIRQNYKEGGGGVSVEIKLNNTINQILQYNKSNITISQIFYEGTIQKSDYSRVAIKRDKKKEALPNGH